VSRREIPSQASLDAIGVSRSHRVPTGRPSRLFAWSTAMLDVVMLAIGFIFFAASIAYVYACDQL
jgi:hypothetical protein